MLHVSFSLVQNDDQHGPIWSSRHLAWLAAGGVCTRRKPRSANYLTPVWTAIGIQPFGPFSRDGQGEILLVTLSRAGLILG